MCPFMLFKLTTERYLKKKTLLHVDVNKKSKFQAAVFGVSWLRGRQRVTRRLGHPEEKLVHLCDEPSEGSLAQAGKWAQ